MLNFYRRFIPHAASTQSTLNAYLHGAKKNDKTPIEWTEAATASFERCKQDLSDATVLYHPSMDASLAIVVDASNSAMGAALNQHVAPGWQPLAFYSKKLSSAQQKYSAYDRELLAAYMAIKYFRHMVEGRTFTVFTDHKPLTFAFKQKEDKCSPRQLRQLDFISQFTTDIRYLKGTDNVVADALSRVHIAPIETSSAVNFQRMAEEQQNDPDLKNLLSSDAPSSLVLQPFPMEQSSAILHCDVSTGRIRPFVPELLRREVFNNLHSLSHPGIKASIKLVSERYVWPSLRTDVATWARTCQNCQQSKVSRHTRSKVGSFAPPSSRFEHVHIDLVGPLPPSNGFRYCLTCVDRFSKWPEAFPLVDICAETVATAFYSGWISRFGCPLRLTTDQGAQFESSLFDALTKFLGTSRHRTTAYHPSGNGQVERFHRQLKAAIMAHGKTQWTTVLPTVLLGFRAAWKDDLQATTAEMVYGSPIRIPGEFLCPTKNTADPATFVGRLRETVQRLRPIETRHHGQHTVFVNKDLATCTHVFLRTDAVKKSLQPPYEGPFEVISRTDKTFKILARGKHTTVNIDRLKPAYTALDDKDASSKVVKASDTSSFSPTNTSSPNASKEATDDDELITTTRSGRRVRFTQRYS